MLQLTQSFWPVFAPVDPAMAYQGTYEPGLVALSLAIASLSAYVALSVSGRVVASATRRGRLAWVFAGAISMGGGIWGMHFIGMLAFGLPCTVGYDPLETIASMVPGMLASGAALSIISRPTAPHFGRLLGGALLMGGGIGAMHYSGMAAMRPHALLLYDLPMVAISVVVAAVLAFASLHLHFRLRRQIGLPPTAVAAVAATIMGCAVAGMHYVAMAAASFFPAPEIVTMGLPLSPTLLAMLVALLVVLITSATLAASYAGRQLDLLARMSAEVNHRAAIERDLKRDRARTQAIVDSVADAIVTIDRGGRIQQWSRGAERIFGYDADEAIGMDLTVLMPASHGVRHPRYIDAFLTTRDPKIIGIGRELTAIRKDGSEFPIDLTVTEVSGIDEVLFTGILRDITDRKRAERELIDARQQAEAASRAKSEFLATMSHEIRTPMNGVLGMANLLASTPLNERQSRLIENLLRSGQALMGIINDVLDFSKVEAGRLELIETDFEPREIVAEVTDLFAERCTDKGLELIYVVDEAVPASVRGDPNRLRQILTNLVSNALKFTERGEVLIEMSATETGAETTLTIAVTDSGIGIAPEQGASVFDSFHQIDSSMTRRRGGSGLGLAIVKQLVELMGGVVGVDSELGRGSRFWFTVRVATAAGAPASEPRHLGRALSVLLVDPHPVSARVIADYLSRWGVTVDRQTGAREATAAWQAAQAAGTDFDVVVIDIKGLGAAGQTLVAAIQAARASTAVIVLAAMDAFVGAPAVPDVFAILAKPIRPSELFDCLAAIAAGRRRGDEAAPSARRSARYRRPAFAARILVAEDNAVNQEVAVGMLSNLGCRVVTVPNGRAAVEAAARERFDLILMDCEMPEMDGFAATKHIRESERSVTAAPETLDQPRRVPIVAVTAHALAEMRQQCIDAGMDDFVTKPFDEKQLTEALLRHLQPLGVMPPVIPVLDGRAAEPVPLIDPAVIQELRAIEARGSKGLVRSVVLKFAAGAPAMVADIRAKHAAGDGEALWRAAHALKSSAGAVGAVQLAARCADIERIVRRDGVASATSLIAELDAAAAIERLEALTGTDASVR
ncbi:MAG: response regulator [Alphaproteobacteria bacterium]|nr:response regulator [Alphaproteobacteria bacterium]